MQSRNSGVGFKYKNKLQFRLTSKNKKDSTKTKISVQESNLVSQEVEVMLRKGANQNGIKTIVSIKNITTTIPHTIEFNNKTITDPTDMSNVFNNYFTSIAEKTKSHIKFSPKHYTDYLSNTNTYTFFLTPTGKNEISFIIFALDFNNSSGPNSIPVKILKHLKNDISQLLSNIFNVFLDWAIFFSSEKNQSHTYTQKTI